MVQVYKFKNSTGKDTGFRFPQADMNPNTPGFNYLHEKSFIHVWKDYISNDTLFPHFKLLNHAKLTDLVSTAALSRFFMVSRPLKILLEENAIDKFQVFETKIKANGIDHEYWIFYFPFPREEEIVDWGKSQFRLIETNQIVSLNYEEYKPLYFSHKIEPLRVQLKGSECLDKLMFRTDLLPSGFLILEELKNKIESAKMTGCHFEPIPWLEVI